MRSSVVLLLLLAAVLDCVVAGGGGNPPAECSEWAVWSTTTVYSTVYTTQYQTDYSTITDYVTVTKTETETDYVTKTDYVTVPTTITQVNTVTKTETETDVVTAPPVTLTNTVSVTVVNTITNSVTVTQAAQTITETETNQVTVTQAAQTVTETETNQVTVTQAAQTVTNTVTVTNVQNVPQTIVQTATVAQTVAQTVTAQVTAIITSISSVIVSSQCPTSLSGLVTCPSRIVNPTYTTSTPLPSNYLWGCPPGSLCHPPRIDCNFEQNLPADSYYCAPEECQPVAELPSLDAFLAANQYVNDSCAFLTPADDYFNFNPLFFGLDFGIFNVYGQATCTSTSSCPAAAACPAPQTVTLSPAGYSWGPWSGPAYTGPPATVTVTAAPQVTKRAELDKRQGAPIIGYATCYPQCDYAGYVWQSIGDDEAVLCDPAGDWYNAYIAATNCNNDWVATDGSGPSVILSSLDRPRSICSNLMRRSAIGRRNPFA